MSDIILNYYLEKIKSSYKKKNMCVTWNKHVYDEKRVFFLKKKTCFLSEKTSCFTGTLAGLFLPTYAGGIKFEKKHEVLPSLLDFR